MLGEAITVVVAPATERAFVTIDPGQLEQVIVNLAVNARDAMPNGGTVVLTAATAEFDEPFCRRHVDVQPGRYGVLSIADSGLGIAPDVQPRIFEPFFTTKAVGRGTGLGLSTVFGIVKRAAGWIDVDSKVGVGTTFYVYLPRVDETTAAESSSFASAPVPRARGERVLLVEDNDSVRAVSFALLSHLGYRAHAFASGADALQFLEQETNDVSLLVTDVVMPGMNGRELVQRVKQMRPALKILYTSGFAEQVLRETQDFEQDVAFLSKPYSLTAFGHKLREVLDA
jgi:CheY-like chemotaxis protein